MEDYPSTRSVYSKFLGCSFDLPVDSDYFFPKSASSSPVLSEGRWVVYVLFGLTTKRVCYVGITGRPLAERLQEHLLQTKFGPKFEWFCSETVGIKAVRSFSQKHHALALETRMIVSLPGLLNRCVSMASAVFPDG